MTVICPKCQYQRQSTDRAPDYECPRCGIIYAKFDPALELQKKIQSAANTGDWSGITRDQIPEHLRKVAAMQLPATTTNDVPGHAIVKIVDVVSAECAYGMNIFKDFIAGLTDVVGGRSGLTQGVLRDARRAVMADLRAEAFAIGADAVVGVKLDFNEFSGAGKSMLFVVATGTAVKLTKI